MSAVPRPSTGARMRAALGPVRRTLFTEPMEQGRLRLDGVPGLERTLAVGALVVLGGLLIVLLVGDAFRHSALIRLNDIDDRWTFVPLTLLPLAIVALFGGWLTFLWGAARGNIWVALAGAFTHLLINGTIGDVSGGVGGATFNHVVPIVNRAGYFAAAGVIVVYAFCNLKPAWGRRARPVAFPLLTLSLLAMYGSALLLGLDAVRHGFPSIAVLGIDGNVDSISALLQPMILLAVVALVDFSYNLANAFGSPAVDFSARAVKIGLAVLVAVKLWFVLFRHLGDWATYVRISGSGVVWMAAAAAGFAAIGIWWRRTLRRRGLGEAGEERVKEQIMYLGIGAEMLASFIVIVLTTAASTLAVQADWRPGVRLLDSVERFTFHHSAIVRTIPWAVLLVVGIWALARGRSAHRRELGLGLLLLGVWNTPFYLLAALGVPVEFSHPLLDIVLTIGIGLVLAVRWRHIDRYEATALIVITLFSWLTFSRGDWISVVSSSVGFLLATSAVAIVFGIVYTLLADSSLASGSSRRFPRDSRVLLFLGFLVLSTTVLSWLDTTHVTSNLQRTISATGFLDLGIPFAAWLLIRRPLTRREAVDTALPTEAAAFGIGDLEAPPQFEP